MSAFNDIAQTPERVSNVNSLIKALNNAGYTNQLLQAAILGVVAKESGFIPQSERGHRNTSNSRIRELFSSTAGMSDSQLNALKANDEAFFNKVYGGRYGNGPNEGYKYRGRGFNQLTFKSAYDAVGKRIGKDLVNNPDLMNNVNVASDAMVDFFKKRFASNPNIVRQYSRTTNPNDVQNLDNAIWLAARANAGFGKATNSSSVQNAVKLTEKYAPALYAYIGGRKAAPFFPIVLMIAGAWYLFIYKKK
jgi:putative chitinase